MPNLPPGLDDVAFASAIAAAAAADIERVTLSMSEVLEAPV